MNKITPNKALLTSPVQPQPKASAPVKNYRIDLSLNESPFPPSDKVMAAFVESGKTLNRYPDFTSTKLRGALAEKYGLDDTRIFCSSGSEEILKYIGHAYIAAGDEVIYPRYGFLMYWFITLKSGGIPVPIDHDDYVISVDNILSAVTDKTRVVIIDNPGNPTGTYLPYSEIKRLRENLPEHILLVLDCAYADFVTKDDFDCGFELVDKHQNVIVTRTLSKLYGLSAIRIGWSYMTQDMVEVMLRLRGGFNVNAPAQKIGVVAIADEQYATMVRDYTKKWVAWLTNEIEQLGLIVTPSVCNFILVHFPGGPESKNAADAFLKENEINVNPVSFYKLHSSLRISVGSEEENIALIEVLKKHLTS
jgi:histidinol-phosphate aminotransferase